MDRPFNSRSLQDYESACSEHSALPSAGNTRRVRGTAGTGESDPVYSSQVAFARLTTGEATASGLFGECRQYLRSLECEDTDQ
ncbi:hypothetical protein C9J85_17215 [Haloferax sp. wsp5]|nr:hypothetical protein C9J85_17215 [Haloferax sp. wsp5]